jgi:UDP-4-amino-4,6-dideoxy-N-acetyl-beta-L-altrosamine N-acetyltransferase
MGQSVDNVICRPIKANELAMIMEWRMTPEITKYMYTDPQLTLENQKAWYEKIKKDENNYNFMIEAEGESIGVLNITDIDRKNQKCSWGYYVAVKEKRSLELAMRLEWNVYDYVFNILGLNKLEGSIFSFNKPVIRIHKMCGSEIEGELKQNICKNGVLYDVTVMGIYKDSWEKMKRKFNYKKVDFII